MEAVEYRKYTSYPDKSENYDFHQWKESPYHRSISEKRMFELSKQKTHYVYYDNNKYEYTNNRIYCIDECEVGRSPVRSSYYIAIEYRCRYAHEYPAHERKKTITTRCNQCSILHIYSQYVIFFIFLQIVDFLDYFHSIAYIFGLYFSMSFRLSHIQDYHRFVAIDLGLYRIRAGIYDMTSGILTSTGFSSVRQGRKNWIDGMVADISGIASNIEQAIIQAGHTHESLPEDIIMSFPSRWFVSDMITTQYTRSDVTSLLTMHEIDDMISRIEKESYNRAHAKSRKQYGKQWDDLKLVSSTIIAISVDGRKVTSPIWFAGWRVRLTVLNVFVPSSEFNMIRSIVSHLGKRPISLIPAPLILPKLIEKSDLIFSVSCLVDIWYGHTTISILEDNEIVVFETFPYGAVTLMDMISSIVPNASPLQVENIICTPSECLQGDLADATHDFLSYIADTLFAYLHTERIDMRFDSLLLHGNIFENDAIYDSFGHIFQDILGYTLAVEKLYKHVNPTITHDQAIVSWLSLMASELLLTRKDPLVRIMRYVLYQYE